jgi:hypothetical protein
MNNGSTEKNKFMQDHLIADGSLPRRPGPYQWAGRRIPGTWLVRRRPRDEKARSPEMGSSKDTKTAEAMTLRH